MGGQSLWTYRLDEGWNPDCTRFGSMNRKNPIGPTQERLTRAFSRLRYIRLLPFFFRKSAEERIVWRELFELELQEMKTDRAKKPGLAASATRPKEERYGGVTVSRSNRSGPLVRS